MPGGLKGYSGGNLRREAVPRPRSQACATAGRPGGLRRAPQLPDVPAARVGAVGRALYQKVPLCAASPCRKDDMEGRQQATQQRLQQHAPSMLRSLTKMAGMLGGGLLMKSFISRFSLLTHTLGGIAGRLRCTAGRCRTCQLASACAVY